MSLLVQLHPHKFEDEDITWMGLNQVTILIELFNWSSAVKIVLNCVTFHIAKVHWPVENSDVPPLPKVWSKVLILCYAVNLMASLLSKEISTH